MTGTDLRKRLLAGVKGVLFAHWDNQARDENASGQHGKFRRSTDGGKTWSPAAPLFPPLSENELPDGTWVRLYRDSGSKHAKTLGEEEASKSRRNYAAFSFDDGKSWTTPTRTSFPDACARSNAGKLPDGQVYVINNVLPLPTKKGGRSLLAISLSRDGLTFDRMAVIRFVAPDRHYDGRSKSIGYAYPHSASAGEHLWVIYSVNKEDIEIARIPLSELEALK